MMNINAEKYTTSIFLSPIMNDFIETIVTFFFVAGPETGKCVFYSDYF